MYRILTLNKISNKGLELFPIGEYEVASEIQHPEGILVRSADLHSMEIPKTLRAIARAGAGTNNIPVDKCTDNGVIVFNTPGANANSVKELVIAGMFLASRNVYQGINWVRNNIDKGDELPRLVEKQKSQFKGPTLRGKRLGVIGLGAIGVMVANDALALGMDVTGFDPFISVESAWGLAREVKRAPGLDSLLATCDYISIHVPLNDKTRGMIDSERLAIMKHGARILNFARGGLVNNKDLIQALDKGKIDGYVTDFPDLELAKHEKVIPLPHLGASTPEAEDNCAIMAVQQLKDFLEHGNIRNSVNFPTCTMEPSTNKRIVIANKNIPNMVGQITTILANRKINIAELINKHKNDVAYNIIDIEGDVQDDVIQEIRKIKGIVMARLIHNGALSEE